jgi:hypothetical protein
MCLLSAERSQRSIVVTITTHSNRAERSRRKMIFRAEGPDSGRFFTAGE